MNESINRQVIIYPGEDGYWIAECPSLPGCISQGTYKQEAIDNIKIAMNLYIEVLKEDSKPVPEDSIEVVTI
ncbi:Uncharacterized protein family UPF0150 domain protein [Candidatus Magnetoovum chiemensis]|nr:Uncharacterized protein family UPF0150 domain protein [Candidatus Magnetoovum chiemensis]